MSLVPEPDGATPVVNEEVVTAIISEFSQVMAAARARWARFAEEVHPELRGPGMLMLQTIFRHEPITATGLAGLLTLDKATVSRQVAQLREFGLVHAQPAESDKRVLLLTITESAREVLESMRALVADAYRSRFKGWNDNQLQQFFELLHLFNESSEDLRGSGPARRCAEEASE